MQDLIKALGINHQSPLIYCGAQLERTQRAGNQSPIPFDILVDATDLVVSGWESITNPL